MQKKLKTVQQNSIATDFSSLAQTNKRKTIQKIQKQCNKTQLQRDLSR